MKDPVYGPIYKNCFSTFSYFYLYLHLFALVDMARCVCWQNDCLSFYLSCFFFISFETSYKCLSIYFSSYVFHLFYSALKFFKIYYSGAQKCTTKIIKKPFKNLRSQNFRFWFEKFVHSVVNFVSMKKNYLFWVRI